MDAIIPLEAEIFSLRVKEYNEVTNSEWLRANLDMLEEIREKAAVRMAIY